MSELIFEHKLALGQFKVFNDRPKFILDHVEQTHSTKIEASPYRHKKCDGLIFKNKELQKPKAIKTADCMPIIILGNQSSVFLHAGWRGLSEGILKQDLLKRIDPIYAYIGPSICKNCFEVQEDFYGAFKAKTHFFKSNARLFFDLKEQARDDLQKLSKTIHIEVSEECTRCNSQFNSYRRDKTLKRNWNIWTI